MFTPFAASLFEVSSYSSTYLTITVSATPFPEFFALNQSDRSSAHPFHWAAFSYTGV
ncbi:hypothetical protein H6F93_11210 [Leptolyngbya sp. FACHB-671]|uniref:hypothetical protein n=1 Tax=Leptolyngbya sp. FACHB-671 TaxID=2692812 RepID=UPI001689EF4B|nr:hypothetical protein [Leptolyngbya sp. FACHB-671]MBD2068085.1 hypothetical protein [Leptolyngbya sp. FACHB-671]